MIYEDEDDEYEDADYESGSVTEKSEEQDQQGVKIVKQEDRKAVIPETTSTTTTTTTTTTSAPPTASRSNRNNNVNFSGTNKIYSQNSPTQKQQTTVFNPSGKSRLTQKQNGKTATNYPGASAVTTTTQAPKKFQPRFLPSKHVINLHQQKENTEPEQHSGESSSGSSSTAGQDDNSNSYVSVAKSVTGSMDNTQTPAEEKQNFESTYYTKSSTCGFFTFSCNMVYDGKSGPRKVCKPNAPANGKC